MPKTSTSYNSEEFTVKNPKNNKQLNPETINCILSFSKTFKVITLNTNQKAEYNLN